MSNVKISALTQGSPAETDVIPYVDLVTNTTKKALKSELKGDKGDKGDTGAAGTNGTNGTNGVDGVDAYLYIGYASDGSGTGFSLTPSASLKYIAVLNSTTEIVTPVVGDFVGLWEKYLGDDGAGSGTVTSVAALTLGTTGTDLSSTVANGTSTPVITLQVPTASAINRGALSAADWSTFNGKQASGSYEVTTNKENSTIDTSTTKYPTVNLLKTGLDAKIANSLVDAKGDILTATADNTPARLPEIGRAHV